MHSARLRRDTAAALAALPILAGCARTTSLPAPAAMESTAPPARTLLTRLGNDTIAVERYTRSATRMEGILVVRTPATAIGRYAIDLGPDGAPLRATYAVRRGDGRAIPNNPQSLSVRYAADSVHLVAHRSAGDTSRSAAVRGDLVPYVNGSYGLYELALARLRASARDSAEFALVPFNFAMRTTTTLAMWRLGADSVRINYFGNPLFVRHDSAGRLLALDGTRTTSKVRVELAPTADVEALAQEWTQRERAGAPLGQTTRDTVRATIGGANVWIDYGRPNLRGRDVWADGVLGDTLWRTGANAATQLRTDADLTVGGARVPAGTYTLWTAVRDGAYMLVVNRQVGQWGTVYDATRDLVRVPLRETPQATPLERFTIAIRPQGARAGQLVLAWGTKQLSVPIAAR